MSTRSTFLTLALLPGLFASSALAQGADNCAMAQPITGLGTFNFDTTAATTDGLADTSCSTINGNDVVLDVWFAWTAAASEVVGISTCGGASFDTRIAVYDGAACPTVGALACDDDGCATSLQSFVSFSATAGQTYLFRIGSYPGGTPVGGAGTFDILTDMPTLNPANGSYYQAIAAIPITWEDAR
ncbi:MAG: hypothetical protein AAF368_12620, partial [Planctomycetota bacterium]